MKKILIDFKTDNSKLTATMVDNDYSQSVPDEKVYKLIELLNGLQIQKIIVDGSLSTIKYDSGEVFFENFPQYLDYVQKSSNIAPEVTAFLQKIQEFAKESMKQNLELARAISSEVVIKEDSEEAKNEEERAKIEERYMQIVQECEEKEESKKAIETEITKSQKKKEEIAASIKDLEAQLLDIDLRSEDAKTKRESLERQIGVLEKEKDQLDEQIAGAEKCLKELVTQIESAKTELKELKDEIVRLKIELHDLKERIKTDSLVHEIGANVDRRINESTSTPVIRDREPKKKRRFSRVAAVVGRMVGGALIIGVMLHFAYTAAMEVAENFKNYTTPEIVTTANIDYYKPYASPENTSSIQYTYAREADQAIYEECNNMYYRTFKKYADLYGLDERIVAAIATTSGGIHYEDINDMGRVGIMNLNYALLVNDSVAAYNYQTGEYELYPVTYENIQKLDTNVKIGCMYYQSLYRRYNGNHILALEAYFYGYEYVDGLLNSKAKEAGLDVATYISELDNSTINELFMTEDGSIFAYDVFIYIPSNNVLEFKTVNGKEAGPSRYNTFSNSYEREITHIKNT